MGYDRFVQKPVASAWTKEMEVVNIVESKPAALA
jgi:hypothetical protein